ncbi:MAG: hypothetical protein ACFFD4_27820 [Candidatus Odinarchaeota archaeon]
MLSGRKFRQRNRTYVVYFFLSVFSSLYFFYILGIPNAYLAGTFDFLGDHNLSVTAGTSLSTIGFLTMFCLAVMNTHNGDPDVTKDRIGIKKRIFRLKTIFYLLVLMIIYTAIIIFSIWLAFFGFFKQPSERFIVLVLILITALSFYVWGWFYFSDSQTEQRYHDEKKSQRKGIPVDFSDYYKMLKRKDARSEKSSEMEYRILKLVIFPLSIFGIGIVLLFHVIDLIGLFFIAGYSNYGSYSSLFTFSLVLFLLAVFVGIPFLIAGTYLAIYQSRKNRARLQSY